jgi:tetratricopeptide (TPR) repeat protein
MNNLAGAYYNTGKKDKALPLAEEVFKHRKARLGPDHRDTLESMSNLAVAYAKTGKLDQLKAIYREWVEMARAAHDRGDVSGLNNLAWLQATSTDPALRDGASAVRFAEKVVAKSNPKDWSTLDTLAAAYAEAGEYGKAVSAQREAIGLCQDEKIKGDLAARLRLYESNTPFRE